MNRLLTTTAMLAALVAPAFANSGTLDSGNRYPFTFGGQYIVKQWTEKTKKGIVKWTRWEKCTFTFVTRRIALTSAHCVVDQGKPRKTVNINIGKSTLEANVVAVHPEHLRVLAADDVIYERFSKQTPEQRAKNSPEDFHIRSTAINHDIAVVALKKDNPSIQPVATIYDWVDPSLLQQSSPNADGGYVISEAGTVMLQIKAFTDVQRDSPIVVSNGASSCKVNKVSQWTEHCENDLKRRFLPVKAEPILNKYGTDVRYALKIHLTWPDARITLNGDSGGAVIDISPDGKPMLIGIVQSNSSAVSLLYNYDFVAPYLTKGNLR